MTKTEAWLQCSARGIPVTRLAYIMGFNPSCVRDRSIDQSTKGEKDRERGTPESSRGSSEFLFPPCSFVFYLKFLPLYHHTARGAACTCHQEIYTK